jgi:hypothetical protein
MLPTSINWSIWDSISDIPCIDLPMEEHTLSSTLIFNVNLQMLQVNQTISIIEHTETDGETIAESLELF